MLSFRLQACITYVTSLTRAYLLAPPSLPLQCNTCYSPPSGSVSSLRTFHTVQFYSCLFFEACSDALWLSRPHVISHSNCVTKIFFIDCRPSRSAQQQASQTVLRRLHPLVVFQFAGQLRDMIVLPAAADGITRSSNAVGNCRGLPACGSLL